MKNGIIRAVAWLFLLANIGALVLIWHGISGPLLNQPQSTGLPDLALGRLAGLLLQFAVLLQLVLIGRMSIIEQAFGHDRMNQLHRWTGYSLPILLLMHPLFLSLSHGVLTQQSTTGGFLDLVRSWPDVFNALFGALLFVTVIILSVPWIRRKLKYESWHSVHLLTYLAIAFAWGHQETGAELRNSSANLYWSLLNFGVFGLYFAYRFLRPLVDLWRYDFRVIGVERETKDVVSVVIGGRGVMRLKAKPGQFFNFRFLTKDSWWQSHPFSLSAMPDDGRLRITVKALGDFTSGLERMPVGTRVIVEGPLGRFTADRAVGMDVLLIAGGVGITPLRALMEQFVREGKKADMIYSARTHEDMVLKDELDTMVGRSGRVKYLASESEGHLTPEMIKELAPDVAGRMVYVCGPAPMMGAVRRQLRGLGVPAGHIIIEEFALG